MASSNNAERENSKLDNLHVIVGTGPLGQAVKNLLVTQGVAVRMVSRSTRARSDGSVQYVAGDASDANAATQFCGGASVVYNCAQPPYTQWSSLFPPIQTALLDATAAAGAIFVSAENTYMYGAATGDMTESMPYAPNSRKGVVRAQLAEQVADAHASGKVRTTAGRAADFYGPGVVMSSLGERFIKPIIAGKDVAVLGDPDLPHTYTFIEDFAHALVTLGTHTEALGKAWHVPSAPTLTTRELAKIAYQVAGTKGKVKRTPDLIFALMSKMSPMLKEVAEMQYQFKQPFVVNHSRYDSAFGAPVTSHETALAKTVQWYHNR